MCATEMPAWAMLTFGAVVLLLGVEVGWALARLADLWRHLKPRLFTTPPEGEGVRE